MPQALLLIDVQNDCFPGGYAAELLARCRDAGLPLIPVRHEFATSAAPFFRPGTPSADIHPSVAPAPGEAVIAGAMSHMCIEGATRAAADLGDQCRVIYDACATRDQEWGGRIVPAADVHAASMSALGFAYAEVLALKDVTL